MAQLNTQPVLKCTRDGCGSYVKVARLQSGDDPEQQQLMRFMKGLEKNALCEFHRRQRAWYAQRGRLHEWEAGNG